MKPSCNSLLITSILRFFYFVIQLCQLQIVFVSRRASNKTICRARGRKTVRKHALRSSTRARKHFYAESKLINQTVEFAI